MLRSDWGRVLIVCDWVNPRSSHLISASSVSTHSVLHLSRRHVAQLAFLFGLITFVANYIPNVGAIVATLLPLPFVLLDPSVSTAVRYALCRHVARGTRAPRRHHPAAVHATGSSPSSSPSRRTCSLATSSSPRCSDLGWSCTRSSCCSRSPSGGRSGVRARDLHVQLERVITAESHPDRTPNCILIPSPSHQASPARSSPSLSPPRFALR